MAEPLGGGAEILVAIAFLKQARRLSNNLQKIFWPAKMLTAYYDFTSNEGAWGMIFVVEALP
ncbi:hypothetical protein AD941_02525 [Gluconobacter albidus]|uniref:Uncharacterized protein n=1 Tax=Gluconobacter albidus TaxID=318683 RepID=A0AAW3R202_9PROT|nr:hypothetical protein AD941_02525 [Gluconobacter albidus]